ncbi:hypothetical protein [Gemmatimonas sp.]|jgi:hypothetical protein|uniref:hypothetical protein n=1 Tax=Gemmatimonas sp. TaxID=1962908 RepID=UPI003DA42DE4
MPMSYTQQLQRIVREYREAGEPWPARSITIADWAIQNGKWELGRSAVLRRCAEEISSAMREEYTTDHKGRRVRVKHPAPAEDGSSPLWDDMRTAPREHMVRSFAHRRHLVVTDCRQLQIDVEAFNEMRPNMSPIQMVFDFRDDLAEIEALERKARNRVKKKAVETAAPANE